MKPRIGLVALRLMRPLFNWRGRIVERTFLERSRIYDAPVRAGVEALADVFEGWVMAPTFARLEEQIARANKLAAEIDEVRVRFGLDALQADESEESGS